MTEARTDFGVPEPARGLGFRASSVTLRSPGCLQEFRDFRSFGLGKTRQRVLAQKKRFGSPSRGKYKASGDYVEVV